MFLDNKLADEFDTFRAHHNVTDLNKPFSISGNVSLLSSVTSILSNYLGNKEETNEEDMIDKQLNKIKV